MVTVTGKTQSKKYFVLTNDKMIRAHLIGLLEETCRDKSETRIIEELGITHGAARVDIAVVNGVIHGYVASTTGANNDL